MNVLYRCRCMAEDASVWVPDRKDGQDVVDWVEQTVGRALAADHRARSPLCASEKVEHVSIPLPPGTEHLGQRPAG